MTQESVSPYKMNLPTDLKERLEGAASESRRSLSGEIIMRLEASFKVSVNEDRDEIEKNAMVAIMDFLGRSGVLDKEKLRGVQDSLSSPTHSDDD